MADYTVDRATTLERFLVRQGVQAWRIPVLVANAGVRVVRERALVPLAGVGTRVESGDIVRVVDPPPAALATALQAAATANARDYAFVPGTSAFDLSMASLMDNRPKTIRISDALVDSLTSFIAALARNAAMTAPIRHLIISSHANPEGHLFMKLSLAGAAQITYEDLEAAVQARSLLVDSALLQPRPHDTNGAAIPATFLIRGCRIGTAPVYLRKLKEALGNAVPVIAPKHFHIAAQQSRPAGFVEYMGYSFSVNRASQLRNKAAVVAAFQAGGFTRIDNQPVPARSWGEWVPRNPHAAAQQDVAARVLNPINNQTQAVPGRFRFRLRQLFPAEQSFALASDPGTETGRKAAVRTELEATHPQYRAAHPFPIYFRFGYATMADFMDGWTWHFRYDRSSGTLFFTASRAEYTIIRPIVEIASNRLILNYYPSGRQGSVLELLNVTDSRLFATV